MRINLSQDFTASPEQITAAYADPQLYPTLVGLPKLGRIEVLEHRTDGETAQLQIRFGFTGHLPSAVTAVVDPAKLTWVQVTDHDLTSGRTTFELRPDHYADRLRAAGTFRVERAAGGARRTIEGELKVRAPLVAGKVEQAIVSGLAEYLAAEAPAVERFLGA